MRKFFIIIGVGFGTVIALAVMVLVVLGAIGPEISVYAGRQMPKNYMKTIRSLNLLEADEQIRYFYSDALYDIKEGLYFVTGKKLVVYSNEWEEPATIIPYNEIKALDVQYDDSFFEDSVVFVTTYSGIEVNFPVSSEKGLDKKFVEVIQENINAESLSSADAN
jgi:hypothetical protein